MRDRTELGTDVVEVERHRKDEINCEGCFMMDALSFEIDTTVKRNTTTVNLIPASKLLKFALRYQLEPQDHPPQL